MKCPACENAIRPSAKFCPACGVALGARCPACSEPSLPGDAFCAACGRPLSKVVTEASEILGQLLLEAGQLGAELIERELELSTLRASLAAFEARYLSSVGAKLAELDRLKALLAMRRAQQQPLNEHARTEADEANAQARNSSESARRAASAPEASHRFVPSSGLKQLYRELARLIHPDYAVDENDRALRTPLMQKANQAYQRGDEETLRQMLDRWQSTGDGSPSLLEDDRVFRVRQEIASRSQRLSEISTAMMALQASDLYLLMERIEREEAEGLDPLADLVRVVEMDIAGVERELSTR